MSNVQSPCILVCSIDMKTGLCFGCGRTREEISGWMNFSNDERTEIMSGLEDRLANVEHKPRRVTKRQRIRNARDNAA